VTTLADVRADQPLPPGEGGDWIGIVEGPLPLDAAAHWVVLPRCGAVVTFTGTVRDHSGDRQGVTGLLYETYEEHVTAQLALVVAEARRRWPIGRVAVLHRTGQLEVTDAAVVVAVSTPHRAEAFEAARYCIDTLKATAPIWKRETWADGEAWGACHHEDAADPAGPPPHGGTVLPEP
jgi:molybdopterin synthase catalytic subunit